MSLARRFSRQDGAASPAAVLTLLLVLCTSWVLWSGLYKPLLLGLGAFSCLLCTHMAYRMGFFRHKRGLLGMLPRLPGYWLWLVREIVVSSIDVAKVVLKPSLPICPVVVSLKAGSQSDMGQVILGNSITLSPGTVTLDVHNGQLLVHCLTRKSAQALQDGESVRRATRLEQK